jgi:hypothetical protein
MSRTASMGVGVVVERRRTGNPWQPEAWCAVDVLPGRPEVAPWTSLGRGEGWERLYAGPAEIELYAGETAAYRDNLEGSRPAVYVILRRSAGEPGIAVHAATVDPGEAEAHSEVGDDLVEAVPLPRAIAAWMADFVARHHVERPFYKRRREPADPEALARRGLVPEPGSRDD